MAYLGKGFAWEDWGGRRKIRKLTIKRTFSKAAFKDFATNLRLLADYFYTG